MPVSVESGTTLPFDRFWRWLKHHANCIVRAGTPDTWLLDQEAFHWHLEEDEQRNPVVQLVWGKHTVGEMVLDAREVLFVQATPDPDGTEGHFLFELVGGPGEPGAVYHFLLAHGLEGEEPEKPGLKH
jgi:hypothetical protein